jgi:UDP-glucose 4-epimerase
MTHDPTPGACLITGGASLIGSHLADTLLAAGVPEVRLFDNFSLGTPETIRHLAGDARVTLIRGDVLRLNELIDATQGVTAVCALAGFLTLPMSQNPALGVAVNTQGVVHTLEACRLAGARRVVFSSSVSAYGNATAETIVEETPYVSAGLVPASAVYATTKLLGEALCAQYAQAYGLEYHVLRFSSVYGARQHGRAVNALFMAEAYEQVRRGERPIIVGDGTEVHDYIYVTDVADACAKAMLGPSHGQIMTIATGVDTTLTRVVEIILEACQARDLTPEYREDRRAVRSAAVAHLGFSRARAEQALGWVPTVGVEEGIRRYIAWRESVV